MASVLLSGTLTNYAKIAARMVIGLITFRLLFSHLSAGEFGYYQLLWSTVGYAVLLDFGFGFAVQRAVGYATGSQSEERWQEAREVISTVFAAFIALAVGVGIVLAITGSALVSSLDFAGDQPQNVLFASGLFIIGILIAFPLGVFREALRGQGKFAFVNGTEILGIISQGILIIWGCLHDWSFFALLTVSVCCNVVPLILMAILVWMQQQLRPRLRAIRLNRVRALAGFSMAAYVITMTNIIMGQTDQLLIASLVSVPAIALYMPGFKLAQMYNQMALQMHDVLGPLAAQAHANDDGEQKLQRLMLNGQRWGCFIAGVAAIPLLAAPAAAIGAITGLETVSDTMIWVALALVSGSLLSIIGAGTGKRLIMMAGGHKTVLWLSLIEAMVNLGVSIGLLLSTGSVVAAAVGSLCAQAFIPLPLVFPICCRRIQLSVAQAVASSVRGLLGCVPPLIAAVLIAALWPQQHTIFFLVFTAIVALIAAISCWFIVCSPNEKARLGHLFRRGK